MTMISIRERWVAEEARRDTGGYVAWLVAAALAGFLVSYVFSALLKLPREEFVLAHLIVSGGLVASYAVWARVSLHQIWTNWPLGLLVGGLAAAFVVNYVLGEPASPGPEGGALAFQLFWAGAVYALVDTLLLSVLPVHAVWSIARERGWLDGWAGWPAAAILALVASFAVTAAYHLGFTEFRGVELVQPVIGNLILSLAYVLSASPLAALIGHIALHVSVIIHAFETMSPLPPHY